MREIKFRAWDKQDEEMIEWNQIDEWDREGIEHFMDMVRNERYHMLQYTGLKDKNGKEIYEGDILRINPHGEEEYTAEVRTIEQSPFCIETPWDGESDYFMIAAYVRHFGNVEVIGNVWERPNLLRDSAIDSTAQAQAEGEV